MLEQTCQLRDVRAACLTNISAALCWASGVRREIGDGFPADLSDQLRARFQLNEVVVVDHPGNADSDALGEALCQAAAGYLNEVVVRLSAQKSARIAVSWGWAGDQVVEQLKRLENAKCITRQPPGFSQGLIWSASIGNLPSPYEMNAGTVAKGLAEFFGGTTAEFTYGAAGYIDDFSKLEQADLAIIRELPKSDLVVTSASAWDEKSGLAQYGHALRSTFPRFDEAIGTVGGVFLDEEGRDVPTKGRIVGMSHEDLRKAAKRGAVVIIAGGDGRRRVVLAALRQRLASVLITSKETARWLVDQQIEPLCEPNVSTETPAMAAGADPIETLLGQAAIRGIDPSSLRNALATSLKLLPGHSMSGAPMAPMSEREIAILAGTRIESAPRESGAPDPVARTAATAATLLAEALTIGGAAERLTATEAEVIDRIRRRALYAVDAVGGFRLPAFQFQPEGLVPGIDRVFQAIPPGLHIVELWTWLTKPDPDFVVQGDARSPRDWLISGGDVMRVIEMAESL
jgi:DNA-binding transcriptional regulator LsrR (DeoR family)